MFKKCESLIWIVACNGKWKLLKIHPRQRLHNIIKQRKSYNIAKIGPKIVEGQIKIINAKSQTAILNSLPQYIHGNAANKLASWRAINEYRPKLECYGSCLSACVSSCKINTCQKWERDRKQLASRFKHRQTDRERMSEPIVPKWALHAFNALRWYVWWAIVIEKS